MNVGLVNISPKNSKLGKIPSVSLVPGRDCGNCKMCVKDCYAVNVMRIYPNVKTAWYGNSNLARESREEYFKNVEAYLSKNKPTHFRWHVAGDILDQAYLVAMKRVARENPDTDFLAFTKMFSLDYNDLPSNLSVLFSRWTGDSDDSLPKQALPFAWYQDGTETRIPEGVNVCPNQIDKKVTCDKCLKCWEGEPVVFLDH